jgi:hypothetical protein
VATRYDTLAANLAFVQLASIRLWPRGPISIRFIRPGARLLGEALDEGQTNLCVDLNSAVAQLRTSRTCKKSWPA